MRTYTLVFFFGIVLFGSAPFYAQEFQGKVTAKEDLQPLENVHILNRRNGYGATSDSLGFFTIQNYYKNSDTIVISHMGYRKETLTIAQFKSNGFKISLRKEANILGRVDLEQRKLFKNIHYQKLPDMPKPLYMFSANVVNDQLYVISGNESLEKQQALKLLDRYADRSFLDFIQAMKTNPEMKWHTFNPYIFGYNLLKGNWKESQKLEIPRANHSSEVIDGKIYVYGGKSLSMNQVKEYLTNKVEVYDVKHDTLLIDETNPHMAINFASFTKDSLIFLMGGSVRKYNTTNRKKYSNQVHVFNTRTGFWSELGPMPEAKETSGVLIGDIFYMIGGFKREELNTIETYNIRTGKWKRIGTMFETMERPALAHKESTIYIYENDRISTFNTETLTLTEYEISIDLHHSQMLQYANELYILGGYRTSQFELTPSNEFYKISLENFEKTRVIRAKTLDSL